MLSYVSKLKAYREMISYRAPSSGAGLVSEATDIDVTTACQLLAEVAQLMSELMESAVFKRAANGFSFLPAVIDQMCRTEIDGIEFCDREDSYRVDYLRRRWPRPPNIMHIISEGHVEDFFGAWAVDEVKEGDFNPDENWRIIFDFP